MIVVAVDKGDIPELVRISSLAFEDDEHFKSSSMSRGGPPGHDSENVHLGWMEKFHYLKGVVGEDIVGWITLEISESNSCAGFVHGMAIGPEYMNRGLGSILLEDSLVMFKGVVKWSLETPDYAVRNHRFYEKNGFKLVGKDPVDPELGFGFYKYERS